MTEAVPIPKADSKFFLGGTSEHQALIESVPPFILTLGNDHMGHMGEGDIALSRTPTDGGGISYHGLRLNHEVDNLQDENHQLHLEDEKDSSDARDITTGTSYDSLQFDLEGRNSFRAPCNFDNRKNNYMDDKTTGTSQTYSQPSLDSSSQSTISPQRSSPPSAVLYGPGPSILDQLVEPKKYLWDTDADGHEFKLTVRPFVYSAIGSLENVTQHSFGSFQNKVLNLATQPKPTKPKKSRICHSETSEINKRNIKSHQKQTFHLNHSHDLTDRRKGADEVKQKPDFSEDTAEEKGQVLVKSNSDGAAVTVELNPPTRKPSASNKKGKKKRHKKKKVEIDEKGNEIHNVELFRPSCDAYTPRMKRGIDIKFKPAEQRGYVKEMTGTMGTIQRPNFQDALRRVSMIIHQHIIKIENRFQAGVAGLEKADLFDPAMREAFAEERFITPRYKCSMVKIPMARPGVICGMRKIRIECKVPSEEDIFDFAFQLFKSVELSSECSIICLIYVERLMEIAKVPLMANTWRPMFMCGLLLASKVWQDWSSWNVEFASVYPQFSIGAVNRLELQFLKMVKWDLYISSSLYAKYYFALRSLLEKESFRKRYNRLVGGMENAPQSEAINVARRSEVVKNNALSQLSTSMY